jgi:uncharacterized protein (DUF433 family)
MNLRNIITIKSDTRGGKPSIRGMRITVNDILKWLASGMTAQKIINDYPELTKEDIRAALIYASDKEHSLISSIYEAPSRSKFLTKTS